jgi:hypothetical protein
MEKKHILYTILFIVIAALIIGASFYFSQKGGDVQNGTASVIEGLGDGAEAPKETVTAKHQYKDGVHIVAGEITVPTPCHILEADAVVNSDTSPEQVTIRLKSSTKADGCIQIITPARFKVEFKASKDAVIKMTLNGKPVILNLIEAGADEDLEDFELFIKG